MTVEVEQEDSEEDVDIGGHTQSMSISDWDDSESDDSLLDSSGSGGSDGGDGGRQDIEIPQVGDVSVAEGGGDGDKEGEDEQVLRAWIRILEDLVATLRKWRMDDHIVSWLLRGIILQEIGIGLLMIEIDSIE